MQCDLVLICDMLGAAYRNTVGTGSEQFTHTKILHYAEMDKLLIGIRHYNDLIGLNQVDQIDLACPFADLMCGGVELHTLYLLSN